MLGATLLSRTRPAVGLAALALATAAACTEPATALRVRIGASEEVAAALARLELAVSSEDGQPLYSHQWDQPELPADLTFTMGADRVVVFEARGLGSDRAVLASDSARAEFVEGEVRWVDLSLGGCEGCADGDADGDSDADGDADGDSDADADADGDADADADEDTGPGTMFVNPGCDPVVQSSGIDAAWTQTVAGRELLHVTQGTRRWALDLAAVSWSESWATANLGATWAAATLPAGPPNPGFDDDVLSNGITAAWTFSSGSAPTHLAVVAGTRHFTLDLALGEWTAADDRSGVLAEVLLGRATLAGTACGGVPLTNPGANPTIQTEGFRAISEWGAGGGMRMAGAGQLWYAAYPAPGSFSFEFTCEFDSQAVEFRLAGPTCDFEGVNPGCDTLVDLHGIDAAYWTSTGGGVFHVTQGTRHWGRDVGTWLTDQRIENLGEHWRTTTSPDCTVTLPEA